MDNKLPKNFKIGGYYCTGEFRLPKRGDLYDAANGHSFVGECVTNFIKDRIDDGCRNIFSREPKINRKLVLV